MSTKILLAPVGAGKTAYVLDQLIAGLHEQPLARVWVLVSGKRQEDAFRQRLIERAGGRKVYFNVEFFSFYQLYHRLLKIAQQPARVLDDAARFGLLRAILSDLKANDRLRVYEAIAETPGFVRIMAEFIYELKQNLVRPDIFSNLAEKLSDKDREIASIYAAYQEKLVEFDLVDREGDGWLALFYLRQESYDHIGRDVDLLLVDGFDQFTPLQASLLMLIAERARQTIITLATAPHRLDTVGRRFVEALRQLETYAVTIPPVVEEPLAMRAANRPAALQNLVDHLFLREAQPHSAEGRIILIEAPDAAQEAAAVLRRVKQRLLDGAQPDDVLIALRDWPRYAGHFAAQGRVFGVPLALHHGDALPQNPAVTALMNLLSLHESDFRRRDLLDVLRSPYFAVPGLGSPQADQLEAISRRFVVTGGRSNWLDAIAQAGLPAVSGEEDDGMSAEPLLDADSAAQLAADLTAFFEQVTPPENESLAFYVYWLHSLIGRDQVVDLDDEASWPSTSAPFFLRAKGRKVALEVPLPQGEGRFAGVSAAYTLNMPAQIRQGDMPDVVDRDLIALDELMHVLRSLLAAETLLGALNASRPMNREAFLLELRTAVQNSSINRSPSRFGRVLVTTVADARGLPHKHVFIPGLSEGIFPAPLPEDPLYLDSERRNLINLGVVLETRAERASDDGLFYQLVGLARETLTLSRPTVQDGAPWIASHLWRAVTAVLSDASDIIRANRVSVGDVVSLDQAASSGELLMALAHGLSQAVPSYDAGGAYQYVMQFYPALWRRIHRARAIELRRLARRMRHDQYSGRLHDPALIAYAADQLGPGRVWSATQLNDYGKCGFRFFARRLLRLEALEEPEEALDAAKLGTINHAILEAAYREIGRRGLTISPENAADALEILRAAAGPILDVAPRKLGFADNALWQQEKAILLRRLRALVSLDFSDQNPIAKKITPGERTVYLQEAPFSTDGGVPVLIPIEVDGRAERLRVQGYIDRMDRVGNQVIVVDYKSGTTTIPVTEMRDGRNFQMMLYLHAADQILAAQSASLSVMGGLFWHIRNQKSSGDVRLDDEGITYLALAQEHIGRYIAAGRRGDFSVHARKLDAGKCEHYCEFSRLCRVAGTNRYKPRDDA
jgi:ATP-dependent helicase/nuclease subunit B